MELYKFLKTVPRSVTYLAVIALAMLGVKVLFLNRWPAPCILLYEVGVLVESILGSILASYFFYLVVVHLKDVNDKKAVGPYIDRQISRIVDDCQTILLMIGKESGSPLFLESTSLDAIKVALSKIRTNTKGPIYVGPSVGNQGTFIQYLAFKKKSTEDSIAKVLSQIIYVDAKLVIHLAKINECCYFTTVDFLAKNHMADSDLSNCAPTLYEYCELCRELKSHTLRSNFSA